MLISGGEDRCVRFWNINTAEPSRVSKLFGSWVDHVEWGQRGNKVVSSTKNGELQFWEPYNVSPSLRIDTKGRAISSLALSPDEELLGVSFENGTLDIYNTTSGAKVIPLDADGLPFDSLLFSQEGKLLAGSYKDRRVKVWRTDNWLPFLLKPSTPSKSRRKTVPASIMFWDDTICLAWFSDHDKKKVLIRKFNTSDIKHSRMPKPEAIPLSANEIQEAQRQFPDWDINEKGMSRLYTFSNFLAAIEFIQKCASVIDQYDHHPEWTNTFNRVHVTFTTVKIGKKLTKIDLQASRLLDAIFEREAED
jgi:4a-hydroxytetrahydrobiopterin dehydratase